MVKDGTNGSKKRLRGVCANPPSEPRISQSAKFYRDRVSKIASDFDSCTLQEAFEKWDVETVRRFAAMYAKDAVVSALESLGINVHWELRSYSEIVRNPKTAPTLRLEALSKIQSIRATVFDNRVGPTPKRATSAAAKEASEVSPAMRQEAESAGEKWGPQEDCG